VERLTQVLGSAPAEAEAEAAAAGGAEEAAAEAAPPATPGGSRRSTRGRPSPAAAADTPATATEEEYSSAEATPVSSVKRSPEELTQATANLENLRQAAAAAAEAVTAAAAVTAPNGGEGVPAVAAAVAPDAAAAAANGDERARWLMDFERATGADPEDRLTEAANGGERGGAGRGGAGRGAVVFSIFVSFCVKNLQPPAVVLARTCFYIHSRSWFHRCFVCPVLVCGRTRREGGGKGGRARWGAFERYHSPCLIVPCAFLAPCFSLLFPPRLKLHAWFGFRRPSALASFFLHTYMSYVFPKTPNDM